MYAPARAAATDPDGEPILFAALLLLRSCQLEHEETASFDWSVFANHPGGGNTMAMRPICNSFLATTHRSITAAYALHVILPIVGGGIICVLWRPTCLLVFRWIEAVHLDRLAMDARAAGEAMRPGIPDWFIYSLPDCLWSYAVVACIGIIWREETQLDRRWYTLPTQHPFSALAWLAVGPIMGVGSELAQALGWLRGTFELLDLAFYISGSLLAWWIICSAERK